MEHLSFFCSAHTHSWAHNQSQIEQKKMISSGLDLVGAEKWGGVERTIPHPFSKIWLSTYRLASGYHGGVDTGHEMGNPPFLAQLMVILLYNGLKKTSTVAPTIAHTCTCGWAKSCSFWGQKVPPERIFKPKTSVRWCLMRYICVANCIGARHTTSLRRKSKKAKKKLLLDIPILPPNRQNKKTSFVKRL